MFIHIGKPRGHAPPQIFSIIILHFKMRYSKQSSFIYSKQSSFKQSRSAIKRR